MTRPILVDCEQGSPAWAAARLGKVTASRFGDVCAILKKKKTEAADRKNYREELLVEMLTGREVYKHVTREMQWGTDQEPFARAAYELDRDVLVETPGFVIHPELHRFGASPDGLVPPDGMMQIKCPNTSTHLRWMLEGKIPAEHAPQMLAEMAVTGRQWNDFVSFDPRLPEHLQLYICRWERNERLIALVEREVRMFNQELDELLRQYPQAGPQPAIAILDAINQDEPVF
jgi:YqaJ-like recombinase protein